VELSFGNQNRPKKVEIQGYIPQDFLDKAFNRNGICAYCESRFSCALNDESGFVYESDDYRAAQDDVPVLSVTTIGMSNDHDEEDDLHGLCAQCQRRDICPLKYIRGGVWHCDEFQ
jgi:hypothetical protein